jgi:hypothetical protein
MLLTEETYFLLSTLPRFDFNIFRAPRFRYHLQDIVCSLNGIVGNVEAFVSLWRCAAAVPTASRVDALPIKFYINNVTKE